jgi:type IV secretory pathway VirB10-like protein
MTYSTFARVLSATVLGAAVTGCATVQGDAYYDQPGYYSTTPVYSQPVYPAYSSPPPAVIYYGRDRDDRWERDRQRNDWRQRERERERAREAAERDRQARERDRDRREQQAREADRRQRDREQAERDRRQREAQSGRVPPGSSSPHPHDWRSRQFSNSSFDKP